VVCCGYGNGSSGCIKCGVVFDQLCDCQIIKDDHSLRILLGLISVSMKPQSLHDRSCKLWLCCVLLSSSNPCRGERYFYCVGPTRPNI
jgi:hypothetical protein